MDTLRNSRSAARRAYCPECNAKPGEKCIGHLGKKRSSCHQERWNVYRDFKKEQAKND